MVGNSPSLFPEVEYVLSKAASPYIRAKRGENPMVPHFPCEDGKFLVRVYCLP